MFYRPNVFFDCDNQEVNSTKEDVLLRIVDGLKKRGRKLPKIIIVVDYFNEVSKIKKLLMLKLRTQAYATEVRNPKTLMVQAFHECLPVTDYEFILNEFIKPESIIRVLVCQTEYLPIIEAEDIRIIVNYHTKYEKLPHVSHFINTSNEQ